MSDRLWLGSTRKKVADINLIDYSNMKDAILDFSKMPGPLKVIGSPDMVRKAKEVWSELYTKYTGGDYDDDDFVWVHPDNVGWRCISDDNDNDAAS